MELRPIHVGTQLHGYCGGMFGLDSYLDKRVEAIGFDWVVAREESGRIVFAEGEGMAIRLQQYLVRQEDR